MDHDLNSLAAFTDGRLDMAERQQVIDHLAACPECRAVVARYARGAYPDAREAAGVPRSRVVRSWLPVAAALVLATTAAMLVVRISPPGTVPTPGAEPPPAPADPVDPVTPEAGQPTAVDRSVPGAAAAGGTEQDIDRRRGGERRVGDKVFRLEAGHWIDTSFDIAALLPEVRVTTASGRKELLARLPALGPFADLGPRVTVVHAGTVYLFSVD